MRRKYYRYKESHRTVRGVKQKRCTICTKWKPESDFHKDRARTDGLKIHCRDCSRDYERELKRKKGREVKERLRFGESHRTVRGLKQKLCARCKKWKPENHFHKNLRSRDGLHSYCKKCDSEYNHERYGRIRKAAGNYLRYEDRHRVVKGVKQKLCRKCEQWKNESDFCRNRAEKDGLGYRCRECSYKPAGKSHGRKTKGARRNLRYEERHRTVGGVRQKLCSKCGRWKKESDFYSDNSKKDGLSYWCKKCSY